MRGGVHIRSERLSQGVSQTSHEWVKIPSIPGPRVSLDLVSPSTKMGLVVPWGAPADVEQAAGF